MSGPKPEQDPRNLKGFNTPRDAYRQARRAEMEEDSLMKEAYGERGAALRKTAKVIGEAEAKMDSDSTLVQKAKARIKKIFD